MSIQIIIYAHAISGYFMGCIIEDIHFITQLFLLPWSHLSYYPTSTGSLIGYCHSICIDIPTTNRTMANDLQAIHLFWGQFWILPRTCKMFPRSSGWDHRYHLLSMALLCICSCKLPSSWIVECIIPTEIFPSTINYLISDGSIMGNVFICYPPQHTVCMQYFG